MPLSFYLSLGATVVVLLTLLWFLRNSIPSVRTGIIALLVAIGGVDYILGEFVFNKGPDDSGAMSFAETQVIEKRPSFARTIQLLDYEKDKAQPNSGIYRFHYQTSEHKGMLICHYDGAFKKFILSDINDDK